ncbi:GDSL-type esterase/lipase family protein [Paenibacillus sp. 2TAB23]|uniref:GDSL-type esterase/lipase family protein n=1 Tax=Paenibacillus sp. 2TAB23 TaxID=3233004 RepID=UPI003F995505
METIQFRGRLAQVKSKLQTGQLTLGFVGGSITEDGSLMPNWPEPVARWFAESFPHARIKVENAAIGATGSDLAVFRAERDLINHQCDLIFIEFAVNDYMTPSEHRMRAREGLIRKLLADGRCELVLVYTYCQKMYEDMSQGKIPASIAEFEQLAEHYGISSVWAGQYAFQEVKLGRMTWDEWLPDGLHPKHRGSLSYGQCVISYLEKELLTELDTRSGVIPKPLATPLNVNHWGQVDTLSFDEVQLVGPWITRRARAHLPWVDHMLSTSAVGAKLSFSFTGRGLALAFDFGKKSAEFIYRLDGGPAITSSRERPSWCADGGWFQIYWIANELEDGQHHVELEVVHGNRADCTGTNFHLALIGIVK